MPPSPNNGEKVLCTADFALLSAPEASRMQRIAHVILFYENRQTSGIYYNLKHIYPNPVTTITASLSSSLPTNNTTAEGRLVLNDLLRNVLQEHVDRGYFIVVDRDAPLHFQSCKHHLISTYFLEVVNPSPRRRPTSTVEEVALGRRRASSTLIPSPSLLSLHTSVSSLILADGVF